MPREQIVWQVGIGLFLLAVGAVAGPLLKRVWAWMNRPKPLTPQTKGQLVTSIAMQEKVLERLDYYSTHSKDLFLYFFQVAMIALLCFIGAFGLYTYAPLSIAQPFVLMFLILAGVVSFIGLVEAGRMSDKK